MTFSLQDYKDKLSKELYGVTVTEAHEKGVCLQCNLPALPRCYSAAGRKEYRIPGLCEYCFDALTGEED